MILVVLFCLVIIAANFANEHWHMIHFAGLTFGAGIPIGVLLLPLRDSIQERHKRRLAFAAILVGTGAAAFFTSFDHGVLAALTLIWIELLDFGLYTYFRKYGWLVGVLVSDIVVSPLVPILYAFFSRNPVTISSDVIIVRYAVLALVYIWLIATNRYFKAFGDYPMWRKPTQVEG